MTTQSIPSSAVIRGACVIAPSSSTRQPCRQWHEQDGFILILSGYLDQRDRLHASLGLSLDAAQTLTDAALVLAVWRRWGESGLARLQGPIALVLADLNDSQRPRIVLYREPLGRRGLYYFSSPHLLLVADEPAALLAHPAVSSQSDERWLAGHFALARPADNRTPFRDIRKLLPGERLICTPEDIRLHREPLVFGQQTLFYRNDQDYAEHFRVLLDQAVARCLHDSGDRTGIMLSGGMDSGPLAALAQRRLSGEGRALTAYSWSLPGYPSADESAEITICARHVGCGLQLLPGSAEWPMRDLSTWPVNLNSPLANGFRRLKLAIYHAAAAEGCRVILNGAAGDRLYPHSSYCLLEWWRDRRLGSVVREIARIGWAGGILGLWRNAAIRRFGKRLLGWRGTRPVSAPVWLSANARQLWRET
ncbi:MAG TPA: asparagine synthase-related protein, partial [Candidatus Competibacter phosphatis]|nr:asparagine synthase-related protein [Candidatus Competibacter phosphatis]